VTRTVYSAVWVFYSECEKPQWHTMPILLSLSGGREVAVGRCSNRRAAIFQDRWSWQSIRIAYTQLHAAS
jgi:hypothetical protein